MRPGPTLFYTNGYPFGVLPAFYYLSVTDAGSSRVITGLPLGSDPWLLGYIFFRSMQAAQRNNGAETHPFLPSGEWEGFYTYAPGPAADQHPMQFTLNFKNQAVTGSGSDDVGEFNWQGTYTLAQLECTLTKKYRTHLVYYRGQVDENGIWGQWQLAGMRGGFHIWPKTSAGHAATEAVAAEAAVLVESLPRPMPGPSWP